MNNKMTLRVLAVSQHIS